MVVVVDNLGIGIVDQMRIGAGAGIVGDGVFAAIICDSNHIRFAVFLDPLHLEGSLSVLFAIPKESIPLVVIFFSASRRYDGIQLEHFLQFIEYPHLTTRQQDQGKTKQQCN